MKPDPITTEILRNQFQAVADDMKAALVRSAFTPIIYENEDCAVALLDRDAEVLGQSSGLPLFLGNLEEAVKESLRLRGGPQTLAEGDVLYLNDPYIQGTHVNDATIFAPVHWRGEIAGYVATRADWMDVGGRDPGGGMATTEVYQEGIRVGPVRVYGADGPVADVVDILRRNSRSGDLLVGDMNAMVSACRTGQRRMQEILDRFGLDVVERCGRELFRQSAESDRRTVAGIPDGTYTARGALDNDGVQLERRIELPIRVVVTGDRITVDLTAGPDATLGPINCGRAQTVSAIRVAYKLLFAPDRSVDGGCFRNLEVLTRPGSMHHAEEPAACQWYYSSLGLLIDLFVTALAGAVPEQVAAAQFGDSMITYFAGTDPSDGASFFSVEAHAGGWGAWPDGDGADGMINLINGSFRNTPVETLEVRCPLRVTEYRFRTASGGTGRHRGGCGVTRRYVFDADTQLFLWLDRSVTPGWGLDGGEDGMPPRVEITGSVQHDDLLKVNGLQLIAGDTLTVHTGGGGGFGPADDRDAAALRDDVARGLTYDEATRARPATTTETS